MHCASCENLLEGEFRNIKGVENARLDRKSGIAEIHYIQKEPDFSEIKKTAEEIKELMKQAAQKLSMSARSFHKVLKVARTIADLDSSKEIKREHVLEALQYRPRIHETL